MIDESTINNYYNAHAQAGCSLSDVRFAFQLVYLVLGRVPDIVEPEEPIIRIPRLFRLIISDLGYDRRDLLLDLCHGWLQKNETARQHRRTLTLADILAAVMMWRSHLDFTGDWQDSDCEGLASIATIGASDAAFIETGKQLGFLPNAHGGLKLVPDYYNGRQLLRKFWTVFLLQLARREMLSPEAYRLRFHPEVAAEMLACVLDIIVRYSRRPVTRDVIRPPDEVYIDDADVIWFYISRSLPKRTNYRIKRKLEELKNLDADPLLDYCSVSWLVHLVLNNLDSAR